MPSQIIVFCLGKWETHFKGQQIVAEVSVDVEVPTKRIGTLTSTNKALCWDEAWPKKFLKKSEEALGQVIILLICWLFICGKILLRIIHTYIHKYIHTLNSLTHLRFKIS